MDTHYTKEGITALETEREIERVYLKSLSIAEPHFHSKSQHTESATGVGPYCKPQLGKSIMVHFVIISSICGGVNM